MGEAGPSGIHPGSAEDLAGLAGLQEYGAAVTGLGYRTRRQFDPHLLARPHADGRDLADNVEITDRATAVLAALDLDIEARGNLYKPDGSGPGRRGGRRGANIDRRALTVIGGMDQDGRTRARTLFAIAFSIAARWLPTA